MKPEKYKGSTARLALSTGQVFTGLGFGAINQEIVSVGEVVFNTSMAGYQESLTDPSYMGQILIQTQPLIGNTGVNSEDTESGSVQVAGFVIHELTQNSSNYRTEQSLEMYLSEAKALGISDIDTRSLTKILREHESTQGVLTDRTDLSDKELIEMARQVDSMAGQNLAAKVGVSSSTDWTELHREWGIGTDQFETGAKPQVWVLDFGIKSNIARSLMDLGCSVKVIPQSTEYSVIRSAFESGQINGLFLSNGPGDPAAIDQVIEILKEVLQDDSMHELPIYGICLGHQLLSLALGASTYKLPFGHRGANHPVHDLERARIQITSQNHGFAVDQQSLEAVDAIVTHIHLNDGSVAGFRHAARPVAGVQFHPEASPGPHDAHLFFKEFVTRIKTSWVESKSP